VVEPDAEPAEFDFEGATITGNTVDGAPTGAVFFSRLTNGTAKLTYQITKNNKFEVMAQVGRKWQPYRTASRYVPLESTQNQDSMSLIGPSMKYLSILSPRMTFDASVQRGGYWWPDVPWTSDVRKTDLASMSQGLELRAPFLDHHFVEAVVGLSPEERFTEPPKLLLERLIPELKPLDLFGRKKRGFNPPLRDWLARDLAGRFEGLGARLADATSRQVDAAADDRFCASYLHASDQPGEQLLQLLILDESLAQLRALAV